MTKYLRLLNLSWQNQFVYRTSLFMWRFRQFLTSLMALTIWSVVYAQTEAVVSYNQSDMISYIFLVSILQSLIFATALNNLANDIYSGQFSQLLLKPVNIFTYLATQDLADKLKNVLFVLIESGILFAIFLPALPLPNFATFGLFLISSLLALVMSFLITLLFGSIGFWSPDTWGPRFLFYMFVDFTAGKLFPLDILPESIQRVLLATPFPLLSYAQIQIFLNRWDYQQVWQTILLQCVWVAVLGVSSWFVWKKGLKSYAAAGI